MKEVFYEESVEMRNQKSAKPKFMIFTVCGVASAVFAVFSFFNTIFFAQGLAGILISLVITVLMAASAIFLMTKRHGFYLSYDYTFVTDELRISKVLHDRKRKHLYSVSTDRIIQIGRLESDSYEKLKKSPDVKEDILTPNIEAGEDKEFYYIFASTNVGKRLLILECRLQLIANIIRFMNRNVLETEFNRKQ